MTDRMNVMKQLSQNKVTHNCPKCDSLSYCAVSAGKSLSACWCSNVEKVVLEDDIVGDDSKCLCRSCLSEQVDSK